ALTVTPHYYSPLHDSLHCTIDTGRANHARLSEHTQHTAFRRQNKIRSYFYRPQLVWASAIVSHFSAIAARKSNMDCQALPADYFVVGTPAGAGADGTGFELTGNVPVKSRCPASVSTACP